MASVLASSIRGYEVMTTEGTDLGTVESVTMNPRTGNLQCLRLKNHNGGAGSEFDQIENGQLLIPVDRVEAREDYLLVRPPR